MDLDLRVTDEQLSKLSFRGNTTPYTGIHNIDTRCGLFKEITTTYPKIYESITIIRDDSYGLEFSYEGIVVTQHNFNTLGVQLKKFITHYEMLATIFPDTPRLPLCNAFEEFFLENNNRLVGLTYDVENTAFKDSYEILKLMAITVDDYPELFIRKVIKNAQH